MSARVERLGWDSEHFGVEIGRVRGDRFDTGVAAATVAAAAAQGIRCLYLLLEADDSEGVRAAEDIGFRLTDVRLTLGAAVRGDSDHTVVARPFRGKDLDVFEHVAATAHTDSRFFFDQRFDAAAAADLYRLWLRGSVNAGLADFAFVVDVDGRAGGYITGNVDAERATVAIGLLAVAPWARGRGLGGQLVGAMLGEAARRGSTRVTVVTQGRNVAAQRLYQAAGFRTERLQLWFHRWEDDTGS